MSIQLSASKHTEFQPNNLVSNIENHFLKYSKKKKIIKQIIFKRYFYFEETYQI